MDNLILKGKITMVELSVHERERERERERENFLLTLFLPFALF
jgi:hypothetical protein